MSSPPAQGKRLHWEDLPTNVRHALESKLGASVSAAITQPAGFSPGLASRLVLADGRRVFLKAVHESGNPDTPGIHRREARIVAALPASAPVPRLLWSHDEDGWVALCFEDVDGRHPHEPWTEHDLAVVVPALTRMSTGLTPSPIDTGETAAGALSRHINGWQVALASRDERFDPWVRKNLERLAQLEARAPEAADGDTLLHFDIRADNILISGDRVYVVDWPWARSGAAWVDWVAFAPSVAMQGGPDPESLLRRFDVGGAAHEAIDAVLCSLAGYFMVEALAPSPPGLPTLRAFQAAQGRQAIAWLRERTGWD